jgi:methanogenic corrinoid protein MtbC1
METCLEEFKEALLRIDRISVRKLYHDRHPDISTLTFAETIITPALEAIGSGWAAGTVSLSQVYMAGRICEDLVSEIFASNNQPRQVASNRKVALVVLSDRHFLGKRIVASAVKLAGINLIDYGSMEPAPLVEQVAADGVDILLISTLMLPSALTVKVVVEGLRAKGLETKVVVGGAPFLLDKELWKVVGADAMGETASSAIRIIHEMMEGAE